jgi:hypothetical protein
MVGFSTKGGRMGALRYAMELNEGEREAALTLSLLPPHKVYDVGRSVWPLLCPLAECQGEAVFCRCSLS